MTKLTTGERTLLTMAATEHFGWEPRFDKARPKWKPVLRVMRTAGLVTFTDADPQIRITDAGRQALREEGTRWHEGGA